MAMETHFHQQLNGFKLKVLEMAAHVEKATDKALLALHERNTEKAQQVINGDVFINQLQAEANEFSLRLLALDQPMARDLRLIVGSIHVVANLERIGDQAVNLAERVLLFAQRPALPNYPVFEELSALSTTMLRNAVTAYNRGDTDMAQAVCAADNRADELTFRNLTHYINYMIDESRAVERAVHMIMLGKCLERIGDHATNIAEQVLFIIKGVDVKSTCQRF